MRFIPTVLLIIIGVANAAILNSKLIFSDIYSMESNVLRNNLQIAANVDALSGTDWDQILKGLVNHLKFVDKASHGIVMAVMKFLQQLRAQNKAGSGTLDVPDNILNNVIDILNEFNDAINQAPLHDLIDTLAKNKGSLASHRGIILLNPELGERIIQMISYFNSQFYKTKTVLAQLQNALEQLSESVTKDGTKSGYTNYLIKQLANTIGVQNDALTNVVISIEELLRNVRKAVTFKLDGQYVVYGKILAKAVKIASTAISNDFNKIVDSIETFLQLITDSNSVS